METPAIKRKDNVPLEEIPDEILNITLTNEDKKLLSLGDQTALFENVIFPDGRVKDCKFRCFYDQNGKLKFAFDFKHEKLIIPQVIGGCALTEKDKSDLKNNKTLGPLRLKDSDIQVYLRIDPVLNKVVALDANQIGIPSVVGDYVLTDRDKSTLANEGQLSQRVYRSEQGYFLANLLMTDKKNELKFTGIKQVTAKKAMEFLPKLNYNWQTKAGDQQNIGSRTHTAINKLELTSEGKGTNALENITSAEDLKATRYIDSMSLKQLNNMVKSGYKPSLSVLTYIEKHQLLTPSQRIAVNTVLGIEGTKKKGRVGESAQRSSIDDKFLDYPVKENFKKQKAKRLSENKRYAAKNLLDSAFSDV